MPHQFRHTQTNHVSCDGKSIKSEKSEKQDLVEVCLLKDSPYRILRVSNFNNSIRKIFVCEQSLDLNKNKISFFWNENCISYMSKFIALLKKITLISEKF